MTKRIYYGKILNYCYIILWEGIDEKKEYIYYRKILNHYCIILWESIDDEIV